MLYFHFNGKSNLTLSYKPPLIVMAVKESRIAMHDAKDRVKYKQKGE